MYRRLLTFLRCPNCAGTLELEALSPRTNDPDAEIADGLLHCAQEHWFPVARGIPRMLPDALEEHWPLIADHLGTPDLESLRSRVSRNFDTDGWRYDRRTRDNFSLEWAQHDTDGRTWGMELDDRVRWFFVEPLRIPPDELEGKVVLDAGCGNGSQSVAYTELGVEVIALDLSSGLEHGQAFRSCRPNARPDRVHFVQGDLRSPPLAPGIADIIHSAGVLHHLPDTQDAFRRLCPLLAPGGIFFVWLYGYEPVVTPVVNGIRTVTTRIPPKAFARVAEVMAPPFQLFCWGVDRLGVRHYPRVSRREAALALMDIFGAPYAHYHTFEEVAGWYKREGFDAVWPCCADRRGFGVCGRRGAEGDAGDEGDSAEVPLRVDPASRVGGAVG